MSEIVASGSNQFQPPFPQKFNGSKNRPVREFLDDVDRFFEIADHIPQEKRHLWVTGWLEDEPQRLWTAEMKEMKSKDQVPVVPGLGHLKEMLEKYYTNQMPERVLRNEWKELVQRGSVSEFIRQIKRKKWELGVITHQYTIDRSGGH